MGPEDGAPVRSALRAGGPARRGHLVDPRHVDLVHVLALAVRRRRRDAPVGLLPPPREVRRLPELAHRGQPRRARRLHPDADRTAADVPRMGLRGHAGAVLVDQPRQRPHLVRLEPVRCDAEPARDGRPDRRHRDVRARPLADSEGPLARLADLGRLRCDLDRQSLLARRRRRVRSRGRDRTCAAPSPHAAPAARMSEEERPPPTEGASVSQLDRVKQEYTAAARQILARSMRGVAKTKLTPDMLTLAGVSLCLAGAVLVGFEERNPKLFFWLGGLVFMRGSNEIALVATFAAVIGSFLVSYTRAKAEALGLRGDIGFGSRVERVVLISVGLGLAPWGLLQWPIYLLAAMAWITAFQRMLFVRKQLRELAEQTA